MNIRQLARDHNISYYALHYRLHRGWSLDKALKEPVRSKHISSSYLDHVVVDPDFDDMLWYGDYSVDSLPTREHWGIIIMVEKPEPLRKRRHEPVPTKGTSKLAMKGACR